MVATYRGPVAEQLDPGTRCAAAARKAAYDALHRRLVHAVDAAGWYGGVVAANATDHPVTKLYHALTGATIGDVDPWQPRCSAGCGSTQCRRVG